jgi:GT2 family glycosyltransferase
MSMQTVTVIVVNWNSGGLLAECMRHLSAQTIPPDRIMVVDNASHDDSARSAEAFANVTVLKMSANLGFAGGNNAALRQCDTEFVALLNPDAFPEPDWLRHLLRAASERQDASAFGSRQLCHENTEILDGLGDSYHMSGLVWRQGYRSRQKVEDLVPREIFSPCAAAALYRRQALADIGGFDEDYFCYVEDVDLGFRLRLAGHKALYVPDAVVRHVGSATTGGQNGDFSVYHGHRNLVWTFAKNMPGVLFWLLLPVHLLANLAMVVRFTTRGQSKAILHAKWDAIKDLPKMWAKRRAIQAQRVAEIGDIWRVLDKRLMPRRSAISHKNLMGSFSSLLR